MKTSYKNASQFIDRGRVKTYWDTRRLLMQRSSRLWEARRKADKAWNCELFRDDNHAHTECAENVYLQASAAYNANAAVVRELDREPHPVIEMLLADGFAPERPVAMALEFPHPSSKQPGAVAFTLNAEKLHDDKQTVMGLSKYLARHWPHLPSSILRDYTTHHEASTRFVFDIRRTREGIVAGVEMGPDSCMRSRSEASCLDGNAVEHGFGDAVESCLRHPDDYDEPDWSTHPYACYDPDLGWGLAVRTTEADPHAVLARALVHDGPKGKIWVRSFSCIVDENARSGSDVALEAWLSGQGYCKANGWHIGTQLALLEHREGNYMAPYIDGVRDCVRGGGGVLVISSDGTSADNTDGTLEDPEPECTCDDCGDGMDADERNTVNNDSDTCVCDNCLDRRYTYVTGTRDTRAGAAAEYYVRDSAAVEVDGDMYDEAYLPDCIHTLHDGALCREDNCIYIESENEEYRFDDPQVIRTEDTDIYDIKDNCFEDEDGKWYEHEENRDAANAEIGGQVTIDEALATQGE